MMCLFFLVWEDGGGKLYLGGYKAAVNITWLQQTNIGLVINTARGLEHVLGPRYQQKLVRRQQECPDIEIHDFLLNDDLKQIVDIEELLAVIQKISDALETGSSVLVHCAQVYCSNVQNIQSYLFTISG